MKRTEPDNCDFLIDDRAFNVESIDEMKFMSQSASFLAGVVQKRTEREIYIRLWSAMDDKEQAKFERSTVGKSLAFNFKAFREKGAL